MDQAQMIGYFIIAAGAVISFILSVNKLTDKFTEPMNELKLAIQKLSDSINNLLKDMDTLNLRVSQHGKNIDDLNLKIKEIETKVNMYHKGEH